MKPVFPLVLLAVLLPVFLLAQKTKPNLDSLARLDSLRTYMLQGSLLSMNAMQAKIESKDANGNVNQQKAGEAQNLFVQARFAYRKALTFDPDYAIGWSNLGTTYYFEGLPKAAIPYFAKSVRLNNNYAQGWFNLGKAYDITNRKDSAIYCHRQSIRSDSTYLQPYLELSRIYMAGNDSAAALGMLRRAAQYKPEMEVLWTGFAAVYLQANDSASAISAMETAARINPDNYVRLEALARYFLAHDDKAKHDRYMALALAARKREELPPDPEKEK